MEKEDGTREYVYEYFPKRTAHEIKLFRKLPPKLNQIYEETIRAFNEKLDILCAAGLRALIEGICEDKGVQGSSLERKIDALASLLPKTVVESLHSFRFMGNVAIHELTPPEHSDLRLAIEVSEDLLNYLYELDYKARELSIREQRGRALPTMAESGDKNGITK